MNIFVAGATGRTGRAVAARAIAAGHHVTAYVRDRAKAGVLPAGVQLVDGDILDASAVAAALAPDHVIVSTLGSGGPQAPGTALATGTANLVAGARARGIERIIVLVGAGVLQADAERRRNELPGYPPFLVGIGKQHTAVYDALRGSELAWTLVCAPDIAEGEASGACIAKADYLPDGTGRVTTGDLAAVILDELAARAFVRSRVGVNTQR